MFSSSLCLSFLVFCRFFNLFSFTLHAPADIFTVPISWFCHSTTVGIKAAYVSWRAHDHFTFYDPRFFFLCVYFCFLLCQSKLYLNWNTALLHVVCCSALLWLCVGRHGFVLLCLLHYFIRALGCVSRITNMYELPRTPPTCSQWGSSPLKSTLFVYLMCVLLT